MAPPGVQLWRDCNTPKGREGTGLLQLKAALGKPYFRVLGAGGFVRAIYPCNGSQCTGLLRVEAVLSGVCLVRLLSRVQSLGLRVEG